MKPEEFAALPRETLVAMLEVMVDNYRSVDGLWFQLVEQQFGTEKAVELDEAVWRVLGKIEGRRVKKAFNLTEGGIPAILKALQLSPSMSAFGPSDAEQPNANQVRFSITDCLSQKTRLQKGQQLFPCQGVQQSYLSSFAAQFEAKVAVQCMRCPPDNYQEDLWCQWMFEVKKDDGVAVPDSTGEPGG